MFTYPIGLLRPKVLCDPDALAFIAVTGITDTTQISAICTLTAGLKADGLWTKLKGIYPFVGGTAARHKFNLKDPVDSDSAFRISFSGGLTHSSTGTLPDGTTGFGNTHLNPLSHLPTNSMSISFYSRTNGNTGLVQMDIGAIVLGVSFLWLSAQYNTGGFSNRFLSRNSSASFLADTANADSRGLHDSSKTSNGTNTLKTHKNGFVEDTLDGAGTNPDALVRIFSASGITSFSNRECAFASIGEGLTDSDSSNLYTLVQAYQTTLSRQV